MNIPCKLLVTTLFRISSLRSRRPAMRMLTLWLVALPAAVQAQYTYWANDDHTITIGGYTGSDGVVAIPGTIIGLPVTGIDGFDSTKVISLTIPDCVTFLGEHPFSGCTALSFFQFINDAFGFTVFELLSEQDKADIIALMKLL